MGKKTKKYQSRQNEHLKLENTYLDKDDKYSGNSSLSQLLFSVSIGIVLGAIVMQTYMNAHKSVKVTVEKSLNSSVNEDTESVDFSAKIEDESSLGVNSNTNEDEHLGKGASSAKDLSGKKNKQMTPEQCHRPKAWLYCYRGNHCVQDEGSLALHAEVFTMLGYDVINVTDVEAGSDWDVLWSYEYPWVMKTVKDHIKTLKPHQRVNHIPGEGSITSKVTLNMSGMKEIPLTFKLPDHKKRFVTYNKTVHRPLWVEKGFNHRGVKVKRAEDIDLNQRDVLLQEYIDDPLLVDGYRFDVGIYTAITSIKPLRIYTFDNDWRIKFCLKKYYPFDLNDQDKYVIAGTSAQTSDNMPNLHKYLQTGTINRRDAFLLYLKEKGYNTSNLASDINSAMLSMLLSNVNTMLKLTKKDYGTADRHFFEIVRTDFLFDDKLNVYLLEANMSPNLNVKANRHMIHQILYGFFNLVGLTNPLKSDIKYGDTDELGMQVSDKQIQVFTEECIQANCSNNCNQKICNFYPPCLSEDEKAMLKGAYLEHVHQHSYTRIFPTRYKSQAEAAAATTPEKINGYHLGENNHWMSEWFRGKCLQDATWC